ncbi:hypothetical protein I4U23_001676 [Adineta vaga]|nr:hypothetical protein I4U23_001676 [Adineta vaga]
MFAPNVLFVLIQTFICTKSIQIGLIHNVSLTAESISPTLFYGSCDQCLCTMIYSNGTIISMNCYRSNGTCYLFGKDLQSSRNHLNDTFNSTFYFLQLPPIDFVSLFWPFDGNIYESSNQIDTTQNGNVSFVSPGIYGRGSAINFDGSQYLLASSPYLNLTSNGFTFEMWIYINKIANTLEHQNLVGQCLYTNSSNCLHLTIKGNISFLGFYSNDCSGSTILSISTWYHIAFVYNATVPRQLIYLNGKVDSNQSAGRLNPMDSIPLTIGNGLDRSPRRMFFGYMDQLSYVNRPKFSSEILDDATLVFYFSFTNGSFLDSGPNVIFGTPKNVSSMNNTLLFNQTFSSFDIETFVLTNKSSSISLWVHPFTTNNSTIVHISDNFTCWNMISLDNQGQLILRTEYNQTISGPILTPHVWTHILHTYSTTNQSLTLYINGTVYNRTQSFYSSSNSQTYTMLLGNCLQTCSTCNNGYQGFMDDIRVYARELDVTTIQILRNNRN